MGVWYITYNLGLPKKSYLLKISEGIHDEGAMKSGSSGFFWYELCVKFVTKFLCVKTSSSKVVI